MLGKRNGTWLAARKFTWEQWRAQDQDAGSVLLPQGEHPFARDDWAATLNVTLKPNLGDKIGFRPIDTSTAGVGESAVTPALRANCSVVPGEPWRDLQYVQLLRGAAELQRRSHPK